MPVLLVRVYSSTRMTTHDWHYGERCLMQLKSMTNWDLVNSYVTTKFYLEYNARILEQSELKNFRFLNYWMIVEINRRLSMPETHDDIINLLVEIDYEDDNFYDTYCV